MFTPHDSLTYRHGGGAQAACAFMERHGARAMSDVAAFIDEIYRLSPLVNLSPQYLVALAAHETGNFTSAAWANRRNPGGLGITDSYDHGYGFEDGREAARALIVHLFVYVHGPIPANHVLAPYQALDPRYQAVIGKGWQGSVRVVDDLTLKWATDARYGEKVAAKAQIIFGEHKDMALVFGRVPHPPFQRRIIDVSTAWADLGPRNIVGTCVHRMEGTLWGTDDYFHNEARTFALTDYGIGGALDGASDGLILMWNDPRSRRAPHANGQANGLEGDGPAFVNRLGRNAVNRDLVSIELSGFFSTRVTDKQLESLCHLIAYWHDQAEVPWNAFPLHPGLGIVTQMQHFEFASKDCPGSVVRGMTTQYQARVRQIMREYQEQSAPQPEEPQDFTFDPRLIWPTFDPDGPAGKVWFAEGKRTGRWGRPDATIWHKDDGAGGYLYYFSDGLLIRKSKKDGQTVAEIVK